MDSTERFSNRVADYVRYRPGYPDGVLELLRAETGLSHESIIADIGSGTGISSELFLKNGNVVFGVEPNNAMRSAAEQLLAPYARFHSVAAVAEATALPDHSVDYVVAGQAFHWFNLGAARQEFARILRSRGWCVLMWNTRRLDATPLHRDYELLLQRFGVDYRAVQHTNVTRETLQGFFPNGQLRRHTVYNEQLLDFDGLRGRLLSSSYAPTEGRPEFVAMLNELRQIFERRHNDGKICIQYDTELYFGRLI